MKTRTGSFIVYKENDFIYHLALKKPIALLNDVASQIISKEVLKLIKPLRTINIDIDMVSEFDKSGCQILSRLINDAEEQKCKIKISYYDIDITSKAKFTKQS